MIDWIKNINKEYPDFWKSYLAKFESKSNRYVVLSTETTGLNPKKDVILSFGAVAVVISAGDSELSYESIMTLIFLILPILALVMAVLVVYLIMALRPSRSFYDGTRYVEPKPLSVGDEGTTA
jgi:hypothetical protein